MSNELFDFGFTAVNEDELESVQQLSVQANEASTLEERTKSLYSAILPLLTQLKQNSEKDYIYWPNRVDKIEQFEEYIRKIYMGEQ
jgi:hypothetical protein